MRCEIYGTMKMSRQLLREISVVIVIMSDPDTFDRLEPALRRQLVQFRSRPFVAGVDKVWGGNRTWAGAQTQQILVSVLRTCWQQGKDAFARLVSLLRSPRVETLDIVPGAG